MVRKPNPELDPTRKIIYDEGARAKLYLIFFTGGSLSRAVAYILAEFCLDINLVYAVLD
jgi:hypothetical protein